MKIVQTIHIGTFTINSIGGASIVQIGSSWLIQSHSESYETNGTVQAPVTPKGEAQLFPETVLEPFVKTKIPTATPEEKPLPPPD